MVFQGVKRCAGALVAALAATNAAQAQTGEPAIPGRTINLISGFTPGGSYDLYARILARHLGRHLPGQPTIVIQAMPGAGGLAAANYLYVVAPKDGSAIGMLSQTVAIEEALQGSEPGKGGIQYKAGQFNWIGRMSPAIEVSMTWHTSPVKTVDDARVRQALIATSGPGSALDSYPRILARTAGLNLRLISGYKGSSEAALAMEKGEVDGTGTTWNTLKVNRRDWLADNKINLLVQYTRTRSPELANVPTAVELGRTAEDRELLEFYMSGAAIGRSFLAPPGLPAQRVMELRSAFDATMKAPELLAEIARANAEFDPLPGAELQKLVAATLAVRPELAARVREILRVER